MPRLPHVQQRIGARLLRRRILRDKAFKEAAEEPKIKNTDDYVGGSECFA